MTPPIDRDGETFRVAGVTFPYRMKQTHNVGDLDPTAGLLCLAQDGRGHFCTWPVGHTDPQHVAGAGRFIVAVWPVTP